jgi:hypothetical protein
MKKNKKTEDSSPIGYERANKALEVAKKLTTKDRKKLKSSTYCGPFRSFLVEESLINNDMDLNFDLVQIEENVD